MWLPRLPSPPCVTFAYTGNACRRSNEGIYKFGFCITNNCTKGTFDVCITRLTNQSGKVLNPQEPVLPACKILAPGEQLCVKEVVWVAGSQGNGVNVYGTVNGSAEVRLFKVDAPQKTDTCAPGYIAAANAKVAPAAAVTADPTAVETATPSTPSAPTEAASPKTTPSASPSKTASPATTPSASASGTASPTATPSA